VESERQALLLLLPPELKDAIRVAARDNRRSMTKEIQVALEKHIAAPAQLSASAVGTGDHNG